MSTPPRPPDLVILSKSDLIPRAPSIAGLPVSAHTGRNLDALLRRLDELAFGAPAAASALALNARHLHAIADARAALARAAGLVSVGAELIALELREALDALGGILGSITPDDVLGRIFSTFCIGK